MKDIVQQILSYLPNYIPEFLRVFSSPKLAISERNQGQTKDLREALSFYGISFFLVFPFARILAPSQLDLWENIAQSVTLSLFWGLASAAMTRLAWRIVGGDAPLDRFVVIQCYFSGVCMIILTFASLISLGAGKTFYPDGYQAFTEMVLSGKFSPFDETRIKEVIGLPGFEFYNIVFLGLSYCSLVWPAIAWGAYRQLTGVTRLRSAIAFILTLVFLVPVGAAAYVIQRLFI